MKPLWSSAIRNTEHGHRKRSGGWGRKPWPIWSSSHSSCSAIWLSSPAASGKGNAGDLGPLDRDVGGRLAHARDSVVSLSRQPVLSFCRKLVRGGERRLLDGGGVLDHARSQLVRKTLPAHGVV